MEVHPRGVVTFVVFLAISGALIALHSRRLDNALAIAWLAVLLSGSVVLIYKRWTGQTNLSTTRPTLPGSGWSYVLPPRLMRWMLGESDRKDSGDQRPS